MTSVDVTRALANNDSARGVPSPGHELTFYPASEIIIIIAAHLQSTQDIRVKLVDQRPKDSKIPRANTMLD